MTWVMILLAGVWYLLVHRRQRKRYMQGAFWALVRGRKRR